MNSNTPLPELLLPAGNPEKLRFALAYGADAVYAGVPIFSLRARENGFSLQSLAQAVEYAHGLGRRIYLTMNIYAHNSRVERFLDAFRELSDLKPDGFIMTDPGLIAQSLKIDPAAVIHLSTQANAGNWAAVQFYREMGVRRIILPRELSLGEIAEIHGRVPDIELEAFVHGSICIAYSGRCLISNYLNHRSANEGTCTNSCRWQYSLAFEKGSLLAVEREQNCAAGEYHPPAGCYALEEETRPGVYFPIDEDEHGTYLMNSKDLCAIELLKELRQAGVCSFKVEGRSKSLYYVSVIARAYRLALDDLACDRPLNPDHLREALSAASRTLMTGFYLRRPQEYGQNYGDGYSLGVFRRFAGVVRSFDASCGLASVDVRSKIRRGESVEWLSPAGQSAAPVEVLLSPGGDPLEEVSGGMPCLIKPPAAVDTFTILRTGV